MTNGDGEKEISSYTCDNNGNQLMSMSARITISLGNYVPSLGLSLLNSNESNNGDYRHLSTEMTGSFNMGN